MARSQWCRENIDKVAQECQLSEETVREVKEAYEFGEKNPEISDLATAAIRPLIREKDPEIQANAIESVKKMVESKKDPETGRFKQKITRKDVGRVLHEEKRKAGTSRAH